MFCKKCLREFEGANKACPYCGSDKTSKSRPDKHKSGAPSSGKRCAYCSREFDGDSNTCSSYCAGKLMQKKKKKSLKAYQVAIIAFIGAFIISFFVYHYGDSSDTNMPASSPDNTQQSPVQPPNL